LLNQRVFGSFRQNEPPVLPLANERTLYLSDVLEEGYRDYQAELSRDPDRAHGMLSALTRAYSRAGLHERALELALELSERVPDKSYVFYDLGLEYAALERDDEARNAFLQAQAITDATKAYDIYEPFIHYQIGLLDRKAGNYDAALRRFRRTLDTYRWPYFPEAYQALADAARRTGRNNEADETLDKLHYLLGDLADEPASR
jgi:tetratricopeptide (TPR) repeat protein